MAEQSPTKLSNRQWLLAARPEGLIKESDYRWTEGQVPAIRDGEVLVRNLVLSFDPTQRGWMSQDTYMPAIPIGQPMMAIAIGRVEESKKAGYAKGDLVQGVLGWADYSVATGEGPVGLQKLPPGTDPVLALSLFGITGITAYFGTVAVGEVKPGETFVVSGAAGATGSVAGMVAKNKGCRVIGIAGGAKKCAWLTSEAGFDAAIDYKNEDVGAALSKHCPKGIDVFFDNVGGEILDQALARISQGARVVLCGAISQYNETKVQMPNVAVGPRGYFNLVMNNARMEGFLVMKFLSRAPEAINELAGWLREGKIKNSVDLQNGLENAPKTMLRLFSGDNFGKQLLRIAEA